MSTRLGIFIDLSNLYYCVGKKYRRKVDYRKYMAFLADLGTPTITRAYGAQIKTEACQFIEALHKAGIDHRYKKPRSFPNGTRKADWDIGICIDAIRTMDQWDTLVIGSADGDMLPLLEYIAEHGKKIIILASGIATELRSFVHIEIPESLLEELT
jgi:uncharacterized LabA/DUF88 family protein